MLTTLDLSSNYLGGERYVEASKVEGDEHVVAVEEAAVSEEGDAAEA